MSNFIKKTWYDETDTTNRIPISAENLNRIEDGIQEALNLEYSLKKYVDENILFFSGTANLLNGEWVDCFQMPNDIDYSKYVPILQFETGYGRRLVAIEYNTNTTIYWGTRTSANNFIARVTSEGLISCQADGTGDMGFIVILLPVKMRNMTSLT